MTKTPSSLPIKLTFATLAVISLIFASLSALQATPRASGTPSEIPTALSAAYKDPLGVETFKMTSRATPNLGNGEVTK
ncbi:MAG: hypothetical protein Q4P66_09580, partial [Actinomycetaceae bacterium]|nr:hypothetical protein [Actinomycetaceae bacterium]